MKRIVVPVCVASLAAGLLGCSQAPSQAMREEMARYELSASPQLAAAPDAFPQGANVRSDAVDGKPTWLAMSRQVTQWEAQRAEAGAPGPASRPGAEAAPGPLAESARTAGGYIPWRQRHGQAYANDFWTSLGRYGKEFPETLWDDTKATVTNPFSLVCLGLAGAAGITLNASGVDEHFERHYLRHGSRLNTFWDSVGDAGGNPGAHFAVAGAMVLASLARQDAENYEKGSTLLHALALNGLTTLALKVAARTESPNGDEFGWPSGHTSSSFTFATVIYEEYGPWLGIPAFAFAGYVGYERIDAGNHDFSDVISGALIGAAIGHAVAQNHKARVLGMAVVPYVDPERGGVGVGLARNW